ncbi:MAG: sigma-70 family RNA polymerase sigma factor [Microcoleus sp. PH2017_03_ELD_O_A]|uniref:RNA polymerase sigma factor n=1 Tax=unclassified Microcoleus TaxID=2642155 RepID=UPI001D7DB76C|nr:MULTISPECIES: hypothetical protein [unclassified Microcoleus]MCC3445413.1 sigma-70 family RNA polymerase sigma factor [Microcoleus sp. PH2017_03_ELD_O_A]TAF84382.1 MAG: sigma-70 family RNA polymerase sigma factor [Oscillatoriales cyanobacterium]MCC3448903.1 sigma-70 family RNA polymerase sigma factor [Microcoleus sp. PH2017_09_SFU_O_A]MCC3457604.1 sigma-70 family RNA polymerase sigma factor [Microcoleus sp. PH2017_08_TRC_O_A]MCC3474373.1 sigma-70 family RNA polymerase sigma factor [Microcol
MPNPFNQESIPRLPERRDNAENFFTYLMLTSGSGRPALSWQIYAELKRNFELYKERNQVLSELCARPDGSQRIAEFWKQIAIGVPSHIAREWEPENRKMLALKHLASYFEKHCYYAANRVRAQSSNCSWEDYLCYARVSIYNYDNLLKLLRSYNTDRQASLDTYIQQTLIRVINSESDIGKFSPWRLLDKKSDLELREALQNAYREPYLSQFIFARKYFKKVYCFNKVNNPAIRQRGQKWLEADSEDFQEAAECYNAEKSLSSAPYEVSAGANISGKQMQAWMKICINALQNYPNFINFPLSLGVLQEQDTEELFYKLEMGNSNTDEVKNSPAKVSELSNMIDSAFDEHIANLKPDQHKILLFYYGFGFKQKQLELKLKLNQSSISRRLTTIELKLLEALVKVSAPERWVPQQVVTWLERNCSATLHSELIQKALDRAIRELDSKEQEILRLRYGQQVAEENIADRLGINLLEVDAAISQAQHKLQAKLIKVLNAWQKKCVGQWLAKFYHDQILAASRTLNLPLEGEDTSKNIDPIVQQCLQTLTASKKGE